MRGDLSFAVHVDRKGNVTFLGEANGLVAGVLVVAPPFVHDEHSGTFPLRRVVPRESW